YYEFTAKRDLDLALEVARDQKDKFLFVESRRTIETFLGKTFSPKQKDRARSFLSAELEAAEQKWITEKKQREEEKVRKAIEHMQQLVAMIEEDRQNRPAIALGRARELREFAEAN